MRKPETPKPKAQTPRRATSAFLLVFGVWGWGFGIWVLGFGISASAQIARQEALNGVYPGAAIRAEQVFLTPQQQKQVLGQGDADVPSALVARYIATKDGKVLGRAYVDTHTVRTKKESLLISLDDKGQVLRIDVTAFNEPPEYRASEAWLRQYRGKSLSEDLAINRAIRPIAGATLTARETNNAVRRVLAIDAVLERGASR